jgi:hypothetical protein
MNNPTVIKNEAYEPVSIAAGNVDQTLVRDLNLLVGQFGHAGVASCLGQLTDSGFLQHVGTDAGRWATQFTAMHGGDEGLMIGWFANAIEAGVMSVSRDSK